MGQIGPIGGRYRLVERLGTGGMSVVWRAYDQILGRQVAIKVLSPRLAVDDAVRGRLRQEATAAARLCHPHITAIYDFEESPPCVVMELIDGEPLADRLRTRGPLPWREAVAIAREVASALAAAHAQGVVHRDVTPANVMLTPAGAKVVDFGISALVGQPDAAPDGSLLGTPAYLAPERLEGHEVTTATDVYALGLLLYRALTARLPWPAENTAAALRAHLYADPAPLPPLPGLPAEVAELCMRCLAKDPTDRPPSAEVAAALAEVAGVRVVVAPPVSTAARLRGSPPVDPVPAFARAAAFPPVAPVPVSAGADVSSPVAPVPASAWAATQTVASVSPLARAAATQPVGLVSDLAWAAGSPPAASVPASAWAAASKPVGLVSAFAWATASQPVASVPAYARAAALRLRAGLRIASVLRVGTARSLGGGLFAGGRLARDVASGLFGGRHKLQAALLSAALLVVVGLTWSSTRDQGEVDPVRAAAGTGPVTRTGSVTGTVRRADCRVRYWVKRDSGADFAAELTVVNAGARELAGWRLVFAYPGGQRVTAGRGFTQHGRSVVLHGGSVQALAPGGAVTVALRGEYLDRNPMPLVFALDRRPCVAEVIGATGPAVAGAPAPARVAEAAGRGRGP